MCILFFMRRKSEDLSDPSFASRYKFVLAANRDEYYERPSKAASEWDADANGCTVVAGKDLQADRPANGTWLGITKCGRFGALTNFREPQKEPLPPLGRGQIVTGFLKSSCPAKEYIENQLKVKDSEYGGYNAILSDLFQGQGQHHTSSSVFYTTNRVKEGINTPVEVDADAVHGLCNGSLDEPWPKVVKGKARMNEILRNSDTEEELVHTLQDMLQDTRRYPDEELPETGVGINVERPLSSIFVEIPSKKYGTVASTIVLVDWNNNTTFVEGTYHPNEGEWTYETFNFQLAAR